MTPLTYIASPYTHPDPAVQQWRANEAMAFQAWLLGEGYYPVSPIAMWHETANKCQIPSDAAFWYQYNRRLFSACDLVCLLAIKGWKDSQGVAWELEWAREKIRKPMIVALPSADRYELRTGPAAVAWLEGALDAQP
jgi:hypothetical protein